MKLNFNMIFPLFMLDFERPVLVDILDMYTSSLLATPTHINHGTCTLIPWRMSMQLLPIKHYQSLMSAIVQ